MKSELNFMKTAFLLLIMLFMASKGIGQLDPNQSRAPLPSSVASKYLTAPDPAISDDFNGTSVNLTQWGYRFNTNEAAEWGTDPSYVYIETKGSDSFVSILGNASTKKGSGLGSSVSTKYGFYQTRWAVTGIETLVAYTGWHPAIWGAACNTTYPNVCLPEGTTGPRIEIDFMEATDDNPQKWDAHLIPWGGGQGGERSLRAKSVWWPETENDAWYTHGLEYTEDYIAVWAYNGSTWTKWGQVGFYANPTGNQLGYEFRTEVFWVLSNKYHVPQQVTTDTELNVDYFYFYPAVPTDPDTDFSADVVSGVAPLLVNFTDESSESPTSWSWDFDGNGTEDATGQNPSFTYTTPGVYTVELTATNALGSDTKTKTNYITVKSGILNPVTIAPSADAYVKGGGSASVNYGTSSELEVKASSTASFKRISFLKFDLSGITANVGLARIRLKVSDYESTNQNLSSVADDSWTESGITWSNMPGITGVISTEAVPAVDGWIEFDVTNLVNNEIAGDGTLTVRVSDADNGDAYVKYHSREATNVDDRPQLVYGMPMPTYTISGHILDGSSAAISNATVSFSNGVSSVNTDGSGYYSQTVASAWSGTATPSKTDYTFSPASLSFTNVTANQSSQDFTGTSSTSQPGTISPLADAYVKGGTSTSTNYGSAAILAVKESSTANYERMSFLKFDLSTISGTLSSAKVRLKVSRKVNATGASHDLSLVTDDSWTESGVTWSNQPSASSVIDTQPVPAVDEWIEFDVTSFAIAEQTGVLSVRLSDANAPEDLVEYYSMEATNTADRPQLTYQLSGTSSPLTPVADAFGKGGSNSSTNYGTQTTIEVKESATAGFNRNSFLKFDKSGITGTVSDATLRVKVETRNASTSHKLHLVEDSWTEAGLTWDNQTSATSWIATKTVPAVGSWIEFDVTSKVNSDPDNVISFRLTNSTSNEAFVKYHSKEATNAADRPQLVYTLTSGARMTDADDLNKELTDVVEESVFSIYPNPASDQINLVGSGLKEARVELIDLSGKSVLRKRLTEDSSSVIKLDEVQKGVYFLKVIKREGEIITSKIIVE